MYNIKLSRRLNSVKYSRANGRVRRVCVNQRLKDHLCPRNVGLLAIQPTCIYFNILHTVHHVLYYPFMCQVSCTTLRFFTHILVLALETRTATETWNKNNSRPTRQYGLTNNVKPFI